jgi:hypothetical protein
MHRSLFRQLNDLKKEGCERELSSAVPGSFKKIHLLNVKKLDECVVVPSNRIQVPMVKKKVSVVVPSNKIHESLRKHRTVK